MTIIAFTQTFTFILSMIAAAPPPAARPFPRAVEPRLSGNWAWRQCNQKDTAARRLVAEVQCADPNLPGYSVSIPAGDCDDVTQTQSEAVEALAAAPPCTDAAVRTLKALSERPGASSAVMSDLAAAYYVRAQRKDQPSDFVRSLAAADRAVKLAPRAAEPRFNQALALEALGFDDVAITAWDELRRAGRDGWADEAAEHWGRLVKQRAQYTATQWTRNFSRLPDAAGTNDRAAIAQLIGPYPTTAWLYLHGIVLPAWAAAPDPREARRQLHLAELMAAEIVRSTGDRYALEGIEQIKATTSKRRLSTIRSAFIQLKGRHFPEAEAAFSAAGSRFRTVATLSRATRMSFMAGKTDEAMVLLAGIEREAQRKHYQILVVLAHTRRGFGQFLKSRYLDSLAEYDAAEALCKRMRDEDQLGVIHTRKLALLRIIGHKELTWREALQASRYAARVADASQRHVVIGELALSAVALGYPEVALRYQNAAIQLLQDELAVPDRNESQIHDWRGLLGVALGQRAAIRGRLRDPLAMQDLRDAVPLVIDGTEDKNVRAMRLAQLHEVEGQLRLHSDPKLAADSFGRAYELVSPVLYRTYCAALLVERAEARLLSRDRAGAEADLQKAIAELRREERGMLEDRERGKGEELWSPYFSRSRDAYALLIHQLMDEGKAAEAFGYAEQARAYELLNLVSAWTKNAEPLDLAGIRAALPPSTFVIELWVDSDRTYAWLIGRDEFRPFTLTVGNDQLEAWSAELMQSATHRRDIAFNSRLAAVSAALLRQPLMRIAEVVRERKLTASKIIFVPDGPTHGLPFAALPDPSASKRFLIEEYPVSVAPSATVYAFSLRRDAQFTRGKTPAILLVGDPAFDARLDVAHGLRRLDRARAEVDSIAETYRSAARIVLLLGAHATVPAFLELARRSTVVHFAGHGIANPDSPAQSLLLFAPSPGRTGALDAEELMTKFSLPETRVVVLSACSTAGGVPIGAEGLAPLVRPILAAGVPAAVGSLWSVSDSEAETLFVQFHKHYRDGYDADVALQLAQLDMLHHQKQLFHSPATWASFQMIGFAASPFEAKKRGQ